MTRKFFGLVLVLVLAGCAAPGGSGQLTGKSESSGALEIPSAHVVDGAVRSLVLHDKGPSPIPAGSWRLELHGTSNGRATDHALTVPGPTLTPNATVTLDVDAAGQPDWQDGTDLTLRLTTDGGIAASLTIRTV